MNYSAQDDGLWYRFFAATTEWVLRLRWLVVAFVVALTFFFVAQMPRLTINSANEVWLVDDDPQLVVMNKFKRLFGNDDFIYVLIESDDFFQAEIIESFKQLAEDLEASVPYVLDVTWIGNAEFVEGRADEIDISELMDPLPDTPAKMAAMREKALSEAIYVDSLISADGRIAGLLVELGQYPDDTVDPRKDIAPVVRAVLAKPEYQGLNLHAVGGPLMDYDMDSLTARDASWLMIVCILIQGAILFWVGRGVLGVVAPLAVVILSVAWTFGMIRFYGYELNLLVIVVPIMMICVSIGDSMHAIAEIHDQRDRGLSRRAALIRALGLIGAPCLLTSLTTAAGFLSFLAAPVRPFREMGIYCATGAVAALLLTYLLIPLFYLWDKADADSGERRSRPGRHDIFESFLLLVHRTVVRHPHAVLVVFAALTVAGFVGFFQVEVQSNTIKMFREGVSIRQDYDYVDRKMGGTMSMEIVLDVGKGGGIAEPEFLAKLEALEQRVKRHELTTSVSSVLDLLRQMRRAFHENRQEYYSIPVTRPEAMQYLLLYEMSGGANKEKLVTYGYDVARLTVRTRSLDSKDAARFIEDISVFVDQTFEPEDGTVEFAGLMTWVKAMTDRVGQGQRVSFLTAAVVITLIMIAVLRSIRFGLISMVPNIFPVLMTLGTMGFLGIYLDMGMMSISAIIISVAVDDTIHLFLRYRREFGARADYSEALKATLLSVGRPIIFTTITLTLGFAVLTLSDVMGMIKFGTFAGYAFVWALLADLFCAPALIMISKPLGPEKSEGVKS